MNCITRILLAVIFITACFNVSAYNEISVSIEGKNKATPSTVIFTKLEAEQTINIMIEVINQHYLRAEKVDHLINELLRFRRTKSSQYVNNKSLFVRDIANLLRRESRDGYIELIESDQEFASESVNRHLSQQQKINFGFEHARILEKNIGFIKINHFFNTHEAQAMAKKALSYVSGSSALIIDVRGANNGSPEFAQYLMSHFIESDTLLSKLNYQKQGQQGIHETIAGVGTGEFKNRFPIFILTSSHVSGAIEYFVYTMKHLERAVIVGEQTMGIANFSHYYELENSLMIKLPIAKPINPVTRTNWESFGVTPDYEINGHDSFDVAYSLAKSLRDN